MVKVNWDSVDESGGLVPAGRYLVRVVSVAQKQTLAGFEIWNLQMEIIGGEHDKKQMFDNIVFSPKAMGRAKLILRALGIPLEQEREIRPSEAEGKKAVVSVVHRTYTDKDGNEKKTVSPEFDGWSHVDAPAKTPVMKRPGATASAAPQQSAEAPPDEVPF